jgi:Mrp family chromosome partitioning ATPase
MAFWLIVDEGIVKRATFVTDGCGSAHACGSAAACMAEGRPIEEVAAIGQKDILDDLGGMPQDTEHCALLAADTLKAACVDFARNASGGRSQGDDHTCGCGNGQEQHPAAQKIRHDEEQRKIQKRVSRIGRKIMVISGKGGVGKSTVAVNLAVALVQAGRRVGLLDVDVHGPSVPTMLGLQGHTVQPGKDGIRPADVDGLKVLSLGFFLNSPDDAVIWRGPMKGKIISQFLSDVEWGDLDFLIVDSPPGTGDEPLSVCQLIGNLDGAVIVTTPQRVAEVDVRKTVTFCRTLRVPVLGIIENRTSRPPATRAWRSCRRRERRRRQPSYGRSPNRSTRLEAKWHRSGRTAERPGRRESRSPWRTAGWPSISGTASSSRCLTWTGKADRSSRETTWTRRRTSPAFCPRGWPREG